MELGTFCTQECFKISWPSHKAVHKLFSQMTKTAKKAPAEDWASSYDFTGPLRPCTITPMKSVPKDILCPDYAVSGIPTSEEAADKRVIPIYSREEIEGIRRACEAGRKVLDIAGNSIKVGMTTDEIDVIVHEACIELGVYPSPLNYYQFPKSVCTSVNEIICHGIPDTRPLEDGDVLNLDITVYKDGYHGDLNETFIVGKGSDSDLKLVKTAFEALASALEVVKPGTMYRDVGKVIAKTVSKSSGFSVVKSYCGHGIGSLFHTAPNVPHYAKNKAVGIMKPGHVFTIEPMINAGGWQDVLWGDNWSAATADGSKSAQFEHTILVTETGYEILTARENEPKMVWDLEKVMRG